MMVELPFSLQLRGNIIVYWRCWLQLVLKLTLLIISMEQHPFGLQLRMEIIKLLVEAGAVVHVATSDKVTPIFIAAKNGYQHIVEVLLAAGADKNAATYAGLTPIFAAAQEGHHQIVEMVVIAGADKTAVANDGQAPIMIADIQGHHVILWLLA